MNEEYSKIWFQLFHGTFEDLEGSIDEYYQKAQNLGLEVIRRDLVRQIQDFLDKKA